MKEIEIKRKLLAFVIDNLRKRIDLLTGGMNRMQEEANEHGKIENKYDTFIEEAHTLKAGFAMQISQTQEVLATMQQLTPTISSKIELGCVIATSNGNFFISTGLIDKPIEIDGTAYDCVNLNAPIIQKLQRINPGAEVEVAGKKLKLLKIF